MIEMKITGVFPIAARGHVLMTDKEFSSEAWQFARTRKNIRVAGESREVLLAIRSAEVIVRGNAEFISFLVPAIADIEIQDFILGNAIEFS